MAASQEEEHKCPHKHLIFSYTSPLVKGEIIKRPSQYRKTPYVADVITKGETSLSKTMAHTSTWMLWSHRQGCECIRLKKKTKKRAISVWSCPFCRQVAWSDVIRKCRKTFLNIQ